MAKPRSSLLALTVFGLCAACDQQKPLVYVLEGPQTVELTATASAVVVPRGDKVELHVQRRTSGQWRQVRLDEVSTGQCWLYRPPPESEAEVAGEVRWKVSPENAVKFDPTVRLDKVRTARMATQGKITLTPVSTVPCEPNRTVEGPPILIEAS